MAEKQRGWTGITRWLRRRKIAWDLNRLRRDGELQRILERSPYTYLPPGSFQGDDWYHVHRRDAPMPENFLYSSLGEDDVLWWIVERDRTETSSG